MKVVTFRVTIIPVLCIGANAKTVRINEKLDLGAPFIIIVRITIIPLHYTVLV